MEPATKEIKIKSIESGLTETVWAEQVGTDTFKILENPVFSCKLNYGTVVSVVEDNGDLIVSQIVQASDYNTRQFMLPKLSETELKENFGKPILEAGGYWEVVFGGVAFVHLLKESKFDINKFLNELNYHVTEMVDDAKNRL